MLSFEAILEGLSIIGKPKQDLSLLESAKKSLIEEIQESFGDGGGVLYKTRFFTGVTTSSAKVFEEMCQEQEARIKNVRHGSP